MAYCSLAHGEAKEAPERRVCLLSGHHAQRLKSNNQRSVCVCVCVRGGRDGRAGFLQRTLSNSGTGRIAERIKTFQRRFRVLEWVLAVLPPASPTFPAYSTFPSVDSVCESGFDSQSHSLCARALACTRSHASSLFVHRTTSRFHPFPCLFVLRTGAHSPLLSRRPRFRYRREAKRRVGSSTGKPQGTFRVFALPCSSVFRYGGRSRARLFFLCRCCSSVSHAFLHGDGRRR